VPAKVPRQIKVNAPFFRWQRPIEKMVLIVKSGLYVKVVFTTCICVVVE